MVLHPSARCHAREADPRPGISAYRIDSSAGKPTEARHPCNTRVNRANPLCCPAKGGYLVQVATILRDLFQNAARVLEFRKLKIKFQKKRGKREGSTRLNNTLDE